MSTWVTPRRTDVVVAVVVPLAQLTVYVVLSLAEDAVVARRRGGRDDGPGPEAV